MSWLTDHAKRKRRRLRPYAVADLAEAIGLNPADPKLTSKLALRLGLDRGWVLRCRRLSLTAEQADEWARRVDLHPVNVWPRWEDPDLRGIALLNANKARCPQGHPYDRLDGEGTRRCSICWRAQVREAVRNLRNRRSQHRITPMESAQEAS